MLGTSTVEQHFTGEKEISKQLCYLKLLHCLVSGKSRKRWKCHDVKDVNNESSR